MISFLISLAILVGGYFIYGAIVDRIMSTDSKHPMPAVTKRDDVDFRPLPAWKVFLIQFLNIAGLGPIFGAIMGIMFGPAAFLWIAIGTIFAGAVHDFCSGVISIRCGGVSLPEIIGQQLGTGIKQVMRLFSVVLLILVTAVFVVTPAGLLAGMTPGYLDTDFWVVAIFVYYILATLLPIDKLIGNLYPIFGFALLFMAIGLLAAMLVGGVEIPVSFADGLAAPAGNTKPIFPIMFVSIACGAISGFHATQSPMMARCLTNERLARPIFYGAMVAEGVVALIWAAVAVAFTGGYRELTEYLAQQGHSAGTLVHDVSFAWLGTIGGILAVLGVIAAPITTGDTAMRSCRLIVADFIHFDQKKLWHRIIVALPLFAATAVIMRMDFNVLWRYFAWSNQTLAVFTLWAVTVWLYRNGKPYLFAMLPAMFMTAVSVSYLLVAPTPEGFGLPLVLGCIVGLAVAMSLAGLFMYSRSQISTTQVITD